MKLKSKALPSNISLTSGHVLMIPPCDDASAAEGGTAFSKAPDRSDQEAFSRPGRSGKQETNSSAFSPAQVQPP